MNKSSSIFLVVLLMTLLIVINYVYFGENSAGPLYKATGLTFSVQINDRREDRKDFAYYTQTAACAPDELLLSSCLGNSTMLDFYVLSYRTKCEDIRYTHVHYIFNKSVSWTQGRNKLYYHVRNLGKQYKFHVFLDDDVRLLLTSSMTDFAKQLNVPEATMHFNNLFFSREDGFKKYIAPPSEKSPWRLFERYLLDYSPAYANVNYCSRRTGIQGIKHQGGIWKSMCSNSPMPDVTVMFVYDALFIAFHDKALDMLFPMYEGFEKESWWISAQIQFHTARVLLRGSGVTVWKASVFNLAHANYPRGGKMNWERWKMFLERDGTVVAGLSRPFKDLITSLDDNVLMGEYSVCGTPIRFPVNEQYRGLYATSNQ